MSTALVHTTIGVKRTAGWKRSINASQTCGHVHLQNGGVVSGNGTRRSSKVHGVVVLFQGHAVDHTTIAEFQNISTAVNGHADTYLLLHAKAGEKIPSSILNHAYIVTDSSLASLNYRRIADAVVPGSAHFPLLQFFLDNPNYRYYWQVEYDVRFSGDWRQLV